MGLVLLLVTVPSRAADDCVGFLEQLPDAYGSNGANSVHAADLDDDGDIDLVVASFNDDLIVWYENDGAATAGFTRRVVSSDSSGASSVFSADLDRDGDLDILSSSAYDNKISWYENVGTTPPGFFERGITLAARHAMDVSAADIDGDGDLDVLSADYADNEIVWYEAITEEGNYSVTFLSHVVTDAVPGASSVVAGDIDGDGDGDVFAASSLGNKIAWYETEPGVEIGADDEEIPVINFTEHVLSETAEGASSVYLEDLDGDDDLDLIASSALDDTVVWYENTGGDPVVFTEHIIATDAAGAKSVFAGDLDGDSDIDIFVAAEADDAVLWYEQIAGPPIAFVGHVAAAGVKSVDSVGAARLDDDESLDLVIAASVPGQVSINDEVTWFENDGAAPPTLAAHMISGTSQGVRSIVTADLDADGDPDLVWAGGADKVAWFEHLGGSDPDYTERVISADAKGSTGVFVAKVNNDDHLDVISASALDDKIAWYASDGATPPGFTEYVISTDADEAQAVFAADINGDGFMDVLSASAGDGKVAWYENDQAITPGFTEHVITSNDPDGDYVTEEARDVYAEDLDSDGDVDVVIASSSDSKIAWYENAVDPDDETQRIFTEHYIASRDAELATGVAVGVRSIHVDDVDGDGDPDVLSASPVDSRIAWYENDVDPEDETQRIFTQFTISSVASAATDVTTADVDSDGDTDVISSAAGTNSISWFENDTELGDDESSPVFIGHFVGSSAPNPTSVTTADIDGDQKLDIVGGYRFRIAWYQQGGEVCGDFDANDDEDIDGAELAYMTRAFARVVTDPDTEWWARVDFNGDGVIDGSDLSILASSGVWGTTIDSCVYTCR